MINKYIEFYYAVKTLKKFGLKVDFNITNRCSVVDRHNYVEIIDFHNMQEFFGFCEALKMIHIGTIAEEVGDRHRLMPATNCPPTPACKPPKKD